MYATFAEAKQSTLRNIAGSCAGSPEYMALLNEAAEILMDDDWADLEVPIHVCVRRGCVVWPRYVGGVRKINVCNQPLTVRGAWYDFIQKDQYACSCGCDCSMTATGKVPTYSDVWGEARYIRAYPRASIDVGKAITIFGVDNGNQPLYTDNSDGTRSDGIILQLVEPYAQTTTFIRRIDRILLDDMEGQVLLYGFDSVNSVLEDLAVYEPHETNPEYVRYQLHGVPCGTVSVNAMVKLRFIPVRNDTDLIFVPLRGLKNMMISLKRGEDGDFVGKKAFELEAYNVMNRRQRNEVPDSQIAINYGLGFYTGAHVH